MRTCVHRLCTPPQRQIILMKKKERKKESRKENCYFSHAACHIVLGIYSNYGILLYNISILHISFESTQLQRKLSNLKQKRETLTRIAESKIDLFQSTLVSKHFVHTKHK